MTENPYQPPTEVPVLDESNAMALDQGRAPVRFVGGWGLVAVIGLFCGAVFGGLMFFEWTAVARAVNPLIMIAVLWTGALSAVMLLLRGVDLSVALRIGIGVLLVPVGYALYVPICTFGALAMSNGYQNTEGEFGTLLSSVVTFALVLLVIAFFVRSIVSRRVKRRALRIKLP